MARPGKVWWNKGKQAWYSTIAGKKTRIADGDKTREQAEELWHGFHAKEIATDLKDLNPVGIVFGIYLDWVEKERPASYAGHQYVLKDFLHFFGEGRVFVGQGRRDREPRVCDLTAADVHQWLACRPKWGDSTRAWAVRIVLAALNWAAAPDQRVTTKNPLKGIKRPQIRSRGEEAVIDPDDQAALLAAASPGLGRLLLALQLTGTRACNLRRVTAADCHWDRDCIVLARHKTAAKTGAPLLIPMRPAMKGLLRELAAKHPEGPLFRTARGTPWQRGVLVRSFWKLRQRLAAQGKLKGKPTMHGFRHTVATELLLAGVPDAKVAQILGHKGTAMLYEHYGHLGKHIRTLAAEMDAVLSGSAGMGPTAPPPAPDGAPGAEAGGPTPDAAMGPPAPGTSGDADTPR